MSDELGQYNNKLNYNRITINGDGQLWTSTNNHERLLNKVEMWPSNISVGLNIFVITEQTVATLFARGIKGVTTDVLMRAYVLLQQAE
jgi:hypothetical protein